MEPHRTQEMRLNVEHAVYMYQIGAPWCLRLLWEDVDQLPRDKSWYYKGGTRQKFFPK